MNSACKGEFIDGCAGVPEGDGSELMFKGVGIRAGGSSFPNLILLYCRMDRPGPSSRNAVPQIILESPESPSESETMDNPNNMPRVGVEIPLGIGLESDDEVEEPSSEEEENVNNVNSDSDDNGPVNQAARPPLITVMMTTLETSNLRYIHAEIFMP